MDRKEYANAHFKINLESLHIWGKKEPFPKFCELEPTVYTKNPKIIIHDEGHKLLYKFPDQKSDKILTDFIERQYHLKNDDDRPKL